MSPDPDLSSDARDYFTRHMRILERTMHSWPIPEMLKQIDAVRVAFSADTRKPFLLKPSFPYGSPSSTSSSPPHSNAYRPLSTLRADSVDQNIVGAQSRQHSQVNYTSHPITPPVSAGSGEKHDSPPGVPSLMMMTSAGHSPASSLPHGIPISEGPAWNPTRIFE